MKASYEQMKTAFRAQFDRYLYKGGQVWQPCSEAQRKTLQMLFKEGLNDPSREMRLAVASDLFGYPITSFNDLRRWEADLLLTTLTEQDRYWELSPDGIYLIQQAESRIQNGAEGQALSDSAATGGTADLSDLQKDTSYQWF